MAHGISGHKHTVLAFAYATWTYWTKIHRAARREQDHWLCRARSIPARELRAPALNAHFEKWGDIEGASAFATFLPAARRIMAIPVLVAWQVAYDYVDVVSERPVPDPQANTRQLHKALLAAFDPAAATEDYYAHFTHDDDNDYLHCLSSASQDAAKTMPHWALITEHLRDAAQRIIDYQCLNHSERPEKPMVMRKTDIADDMTGLSSWELYASGGTSLDILALIAAATDPALTRPEVHALASAYSPWVGACHTVLDSLADYTRDQADAQHNLVDGYTSPVALAESLQHLAEQALDRLQKLPRANEHRLLFTAMSCLYLSAGETSAPSTRMTRERVMHQLDWTAIPMIHMLRLWRTRARQRTGHLSNSKHSSR